MRHVLALTLALSLAAGAARAEPAAAPAVTAVKAARMLDVRSGRYVAPAVVLVEAGRIKAAGSDLAVPAGAQVVDLGGATLLPGLVDMHTHLTADAFLNQWRELGISVPRATLMGAGFARATLLGGVTTARNVGAPGWSDVALRDSIERGEVWGPRLAVSGPPIGMTGGHCDSNLLPQEFRYKAEGVADGPWALRAKVREVLKYGADLIKICASGGVMSKGTQPGQEQLTLEEMQAIVDEAHRAGRKVAAHAHGAASIKDAIRAGVDTVEHASFIDDEGIRLAKERGTFLVMDIYNTEFILGEGERVGLLQESLDKERVVGQSQRNSFRRAWQAGVKMAFGTDTGVYPHGISARQLSRMVRFGMQPIDALRAATVEAAAALGWADRIGAIEPGKFADLIAVEGDPLADVAALEKVGFVMKGGQVYKQGGEPVWPK